ncbi:MAG: alpha/beta fold hydrolase, partial [Pseudomonadota bacterium]
MSRRSPIAAIAATLALIASTAWGQGSPELNDARRDLASAPASAYDENVLIFEVDGENVVGTLALPETDEPPPVALLLHGFSGNRNELPVTDTDEGVFQRTARLLAERGIASLRIDFRGSGDSGGEWEDTTFTGQIADAHAAIELLTEHEAVDGDRIGLVGWSQGGLVAAVAAQHPSVASTVLWAPVAVPAASFTFLLGPDAITEGLSAGDEIVMAALPWGAATSLRGPFFEDLFNIDPVA